jgi:hypothetical protein
MSRITGDRRVRRILSYLAILVAFAGAAPLVAAQPASASCYRCNGVDPNTNGCTGATTIHEFTASKTAVRIELRFSSACGGAWARATQPGNARYGTDIFLQINDGNRYTHHLRSDSQEWTVMADYLRTVRACYGWGFDGPNWYDYDVFECTPWW